MEGGVIVVAFEGHPASLEETKGLVPHAGRDLWVGSNAGNLL